MRNTVRIAHISDIHAARAPSFGDFNPKRLLGYVNYRLFRRRRYAEAVARGALAGMLDGSSGFLPPDLVVLTGDISQHGLDSEFAAARELLAPVVARGIPVLTVPGNHDIYGREISPALRDLMREFAGGLVPDADGAFRLGAVEILPLFQCIPTPPFCSHGRQDPAELARAHDAWIAAPAEGAVRIVIGHYPVIDPHGGRLLRYRGLRDAELLVRFCAEHFVSAYFCGHDHKRFSAPMPGGCMQYAAPALSSVRVAERELVGMYACGDGSVKEA